MVVERAPERLRDFSIVLLAADFLGQRTLQRDHPPGRDAAFFRVEFCEGLGERIVRVVDDDREIRGVAGVRQTRGCASTGDALRDRAIPRRQTERKEQQREITTVHHPAKG